MEKLMLKPITKNNWRECIALKVKDGQIDFVASNCKSLVQASYDDRWTPLGIYVDETMVGFVMYGIEHYQGKDVWDFMRVMVDRHYQGNGYGATAIQQVLKIMKQHTPTIDDVYISFVPDNDAARHVYGKLGFQEIGTAPDGVEVLMHMSLSDMA